MTTISTMLLFAQQSGATLSSWDWGTLGLYFALLLGLAWWVVLQKNDSSKDYFLAGKKAGWVVIGASLFASNIGSEHLVGLAGTGANDGMAMAHYELHAWCLLILGWVLVPFYERTGIFTTPEFLEKRYCSSARWILSLISLVAYIFTKISVTLFAGGVVFKALFPVEIIPGVSNFWVGAVGMVLITGLYTILGGLRAVLYTELLQTAVLLGGAACVLFIGLHQVGGWNELKKVAQDADHLVGYKIVLNEDEINSSNPTLLQRTLSDGMVVDVIVSRPNINMFSKETSPEIEAAKARGKRPANYLLISELSREEVQQVKEQLGSDTKTFNKYFGGDKKFESMETIVSSSVRERIDHFNLWKPNSHPKYPWFGLLFGAPIVGLWYWCTDQYIVQRTLAAKDQRAARRGTIFGAYLKLTPVFIFILPGIIAYGLAAQGKLNPEVLFDGNQAFPLLVKEVLPVGVRGIVIGGLLAALMSSLASVFNSCSTLFTMDVYAKLKPNASEKNMVWVGRVATGVMVFLGLLWIPTITLMKGSLYNYLQSVQSYMAPPIFAVFFVGIFSRRVNAYGCLTALIVGFILGMGRLTCEIIDGILPFAEGSLLKWFATTSYTFMCIYLTLSCVVLMFLASYLTPKPTDAQLQGVTYATATAEQKAITRQSWNWVDVVTTGGLVVFILAIYMYFIG
ncbi:MAG: sodium:solute symporter [Planctomycetia bacterium]|nr:sodium:solute symporter [Planctomycetia bacterium]